MLTEKQIEQIYLKYPFLSEVKSGNTTELYNLVQQFAQEILKESQK